MSDFDRSWIETGPRRSGTPIQLLRCLDKRFAECLVGNASLERLWTGGRWNEGPVWFGDQRSLIWSDIPNNRMLCWSESDESVRFFGVHLSSQMATREIARGD